MRQTLSRSHLHRESLTVAPSKAAMTFLMLALTFGSVGCGSSKVSGPATPAQSAKKEAFALAAKNDLRAWIKSVTLRPALPNKDQTLIASTDWEPKGRPGITLSYKWFVNGVEVIRGDSNELPLEKFHTGDRVYGVSVLTSDDGRVMASERSLSVVIQNRPPTMTSGLGDLVQNGDDLVGRIRFSDPDGDSVTVKLLEGPAGLILESDGTIRWPLSQVQAGDHQLSLELEDERGLGYRETISFSMKAGA